MRVAYKEVVCLSSFLLQNWPLLSLSLSLIILFSIVVGGGVAQGLDEKCIVLIPLPSLIKSLFVHLLILSPNNNKFVKCLTCSTNFVLQTY